LVVLGVLLVAGAPETGLQGGGGGSGDFTNAAGYNYPTAAADCIAVGDEAVPADKDFEACPNTPTWSQYGYDAPVTVAKWHVTKLACGTGAFSAADSALEQDLGGAAIEPFGSANDKVTIGERIRDGAGIRFGNCTFMVEWGAAPNSTDSYPFKLWGCPYNATSFANCTALTTLFTITIADSGGDTACTTSGVTAAADAYDFFAVGYDDADRVDADNNVNGRMFGWIEYEN
jgi:hypothetical protein